MALRKKLYYDMVFGSAVGPTAVAGASLSLQIRRFVAGTAGLWGASDPDRYGNVMEPNAYALSPGGGAGGAGGDTVNATLASGGLTRQAIGAWFALSNTSTNGAGTVHSFPVDFIPFNVASFNSIDPAKRYRPRVRVRCIPAFNTASTVAQVARGTLYIQRQHSIEV